MFHFVKIYSGYAAKSYFYNNSGGANYICLHSDPEWPDVTTSSLEKNGDRIHGVEYETLTGLDGSLTDNDAPCAVCSVQGRGQKLMIPGRRSCPKGWTKAYEGLLVSEQYYYSSKSTYECLDADPEVIIGGSTHSYGGTFYTVQAACGALSCPPYEAGYEIACVVCTY